MAVKKDEFSGELTEFSIPLTDLEIIGVVQKAVKGIDYPSASWVSHLIKRGLFYRIWSGDFSYDEWLFRCDESKDKRRGYHRKQLVAKLEELGIDKKAHVFLEEMEEKVWKFLILKLGEK